MQKEQRIAKDKASRKHQESILSSKTIFDEEVTSAEKRLDEDSGTSDIDNSSDSSDSEEGKIQIDNKSSVGNHLSQTLPLMPPGKFIYSQIVKIKFLRIAIYFYLFFQLLLKQSCTWRQCWML